MYNKSKHCISSICFVQILQAKVITICLNCLDNIHLKINLPFLENDQSRSSQAYARLIKLCNYGWILWKLWLFHCFTFYFFEVHKHRLKKKLILISKLICENLILNLGQSIFLLVSSFKSQAFSQFKVCGLLESDGTVLINPARIIFV